MVSLCPSVIYSVLSYKELRLSVVVSCDASIADLLHATSLPLPPEEFCKLEVLKISFF